MLILVDASVLLAAEDRDDEHHEQSLALLRAETSLATIDLAFYEVSNVAIRAWHDTDSADRLRERVDALADDGGLVRVDAELARIATVLATEFGISVYDAVYVAAARRVHAELVSCNVRDLVSRGLARVPADALA